MLWAFVVFVILVGTFVQLGAYSVWISVLKLALYVALFVIGGLLASLGWQRLTRKKRII